jgi:hypothetical protein
VQVAGSVQVPEGGQAVLLAQPVPQVPSQVAPGQVAGSVQAVLLAQPVPQVPSQVAPGQVAAVSQVFVSSQGRVSSADCAGVFNEAGSSVPLVGQLATNCRCSSQVMMGHVKAGAWPDVSVVGG